MKIVISGASGLIGSALKGTLQKQGHEVLCLTRKVTAGNEIEWNPGKGEIDKAKLEGIDAWINLAGENIAAERWSDKRKKEILESRLAATNTAVRTIQQLQKKPSVFLNASAVGFYGDRGEEVLTEESAPGKGFLADVCRQWEAVADAQSGVRLVLVRFGAVLAKEGGLLAKVVGPFKMGMGGTLGPGTQYMSWITLDDVVGAIVFLLTHPECKGIFNLTSPHPVTNAEFTHALGEALHRPTAIALPAFAARMMFGEMADELMLASTRAIPQRIESAGYVFAHPDIGPALNGLVSP